MERDRINSLQQIAEMENQMVEEDTNVPPKLKARAEIMNARQTAGVMVGKANEGREALKPVLWWIGLDHHMHKVQNCFLSISHRHANSTHRVLETSNSYTLKQIPR